MKRANVHRQMAPVLGSVVAMIGVYGYAVVRPAHHSLQSVRAEIADYQSRIEQGERETPELLQLQSELDQVRAYTSEWRSHAPPRHQLVRVYSAISELAKQSGVAMQRFSPQPDQPGKTISLCPVALSVEGEFVQVFSFLRQLDELADTTWTTELALRKNRESSQTVVADISVTIIADNREISD